MFRVDKDWCMRQKRIVSKRSTAYANSFGLLISLYRIKDQIHRSKAQRRRMLEKIQQKLDTLPAVINKEWYVEKIAELEEQLKGR